MTLNDIGHTSHAWQAAVPPIGNWSYEQAFSRNLGLVSPEEQQKLRDCHVAIAGLGGVGGVHLATLARLGIGRFTIADPDTFDTANFNRQYGAKTRNIGRGKADAMAEEVRAINPRVRLRVIREAVCAANINDFFEDADVFVDGVDFFAIDARRMLFAEARRRGLWAITAGPLGFSTAWLSFDPNGMSFDEYFDLNDRQSKADQFLSLAVGLTPRATHLSYFDFDYVDFNKQVGPSAGLACHLASGVAAAETLKVLLGRGPLRAAPHYFQFDAYTQKFRKGRLWRGNRHPLQRLKRSVLRRRVADQIAAFETDPTSKEREQGTVQTKPTSVSPLKFLPLILRQQLGRQTLERVPEPIAMTDVEENVTQYDRVMGTKLAIAYAVGLETVHRARQTDGGRAIDLACGPGHYTLLLSEHLGYDDVVGVDLSPRMADIATSNCEKLGLTDRASFRTGDITQLGAIESDSFELTSFTDAAHHMPDLGTVNHVLCEMDRITRPGGLVMLMDLVRLRSAGLTERYVNLLGQDYVERGLPNFFEDFRNSMYAAWTASELHSAIPRKSSRRWIQLVPRGLPTIQIVLGLPEGRTRPFLRRGLPWSQHHQFLRPELRGEWKMLRHSLRFAARRRVAPSD